MKFPSWLPFWGLMFNITCFVSKLWANSPFKKVTLLGEILSGMWVLNFSILGAHMPGDDRI